MRRLLFGILLISFTGCDATQPKMAGSKWAQSLRDPDVAVRKKAVFTLGNIGPSDPAVLPALRTALKDENPEVRCGAILGLLKYGPGAGEAIPDLTAMNAQDEDLTVRNYAAKALVKLKESK